MRGLGPRHLSGLWRNTIAAPWLRTVSRPRPDSGYRDSELTVLKTQGRTFRSGAFEPKNPDPQNSEPAELRTRRTPNPQNPEPEEPRTRRTPNPKNPENPENLENPKNPSLPERTSLTPVWPARTMSVKCPSMPCSTSRSAV